MRNALIAALLGCACSGAPDAAPEPVGAQAAVGAPMPSADLCFRVTDPLLRDAYDFDAAAVEAAAAWGKSLVIDDRCKSEFGTEELGEIEPGRQRAATERSWQTDDGVEMPAGVPGGASQVLLDRTSVMDGFIADMSVSDCMRAKDETGVGHALLAQVLTHELGHALGLHHSTNPTHAMWGHSEACEIVLPGPSERAAVK